MSAATPVEQTRGPSPQFDEKSIEKDASSQVVASLHASENDGKVTVPLSFKIASVLLVSAIGFGSSWSSGITGAMKTTIKKVCCILKILVRAFLTTR